MVDGSVDNKDNKEEKTREVTDFRIYHIWNFLQLGCDICWDYGGWNEFFYTFNMCDNIKYMWVGGRQHFGRRGQPFGEDKGGCWHKVAALRLELSSTK